MIEKTILPCGLTILSEKRCELPSLALSYTIVSGSRDEEPAQAGLHHFIEHMVFKGNSRYSQQSIAQISDRMGGHLNAFTAKEITQFYTKAIPDHLETAFDLLSHLVFSAAFSSQDFVKEKEVVIQEIRESRDTPDSQVFDLFYEQVYPKSSLGASITGDERSLAMLDLNTLTEFYRLRYRPEHAILTAVGALEHGHLLELAEGFFGRYPAATPVGFKPVPAPEFRSGSHHIDQSSLEQVYHLIGMPAPRVAHPRRVAYMLVNELLGGGMSSRLNQRLREDLGLVYSVNSFYENYRDSGLQMIFAVTQAEKMTQYRSILNEELQRLHQWPPNADEVERVRDHLKASTILGLESHVARSQLLTNQWLYHGAFQSLQEMAADIEAVDDQDIAAVLQEFFSVQQTAELRYGAGDR